MFRVLLLALLVLAAVVSIRTVAYRHVIDDAPPGLPVEIDEARIVEHLQQAIAIPTVSPQPPEIADPLAFDAFLAWLETTYPRVFAELEPTRHGGHSLLLTWAGRGAGTGATPAPVLLTAHYDVVPVIAGSESLWRYPPFAGRVADGYVWGRGALDNKNAVVGLMEAVDWLLQRGERPQRSVYLSFGHDEELGGTAGAAAVVEHLRQSGVRLAWSLDEGSFVFQNMFPGVTVPVATINTAEKGSVTLRIIATAAGGHSSMPPQETAVGRLAEALVRLQEHPLAGGLEGLAAESFDAIGPHMPLLQRALFANRWLFGPLVESQLAQLPFANAMLRTTTAPTMLQGSPKVNVLPIEAVATVNFRIHPRDSVEDVVRHVESVVSGEHVRVEALPGRPASAVADAGSEGFRLIEQSVRAEFGEVVVAPGLLVAATDSRHYGEIADNAFRFNPMVVTEAEIAGFHGTNERISTAGMVQGVRAYVRLLRGL
ncbi:MAG: M20 family peptidase [Pseudomonadales bacterium]